MHADHKNDRIVHKFPISKGVLNLLLDAIVQLYGNSQPYLQKLYLALFASSYYGLLCIGEVTQSPHTILAKNVHVGVNKKKMLFLLESSKTHCPGDKPQIVKIISKLMKQSAGHHLYCPFTLLNEYILVRPILAHEREQFYVFADRLPVTAVHV